MWKDTAILLPQEFPHDMLTDIYTGESRNCSGGEIRASVLLRNFPFAIITNCCSGIEEEADKEEEAVDEE